MFQFEYAVSWHAAHARNECITIAKTIHAATYSVPEPEILWDLKDCEIALCLALSRKTMWAQAHIRQLFAVSGWCYMPMPTS